MGIDQLTFVYSCRQLGRQGILSLCDCYNLYGVRLWEVLKEIKTGTVNLTLLSKFINISYFFKEKPLFHIFFDRQKLFSFFLSFFFWRWICWAWDGKNCYSSVSINNFFNLRKPMPCLEWSGRAMGLKNESSKTIFTHSGGSKSSLRGLASVKECVSVIVEVCAGKSWMSVERVLECWSAGAGAGVCIEVWDWGKQMWWM